MIDAKTYNEFMKCASKPVEFTFRKDKVYPHGRATLVEIRSSFRESVRNWDNLKIDKELESIIDGYAYRVPTFAMVSFNLVIGFLTVENSIKIARLNRNGWNLHSRATHEQIREWKGSVDYMEIIDPRSHQIQNGLVA